VITPPEPPYSPEELVRVFDDAWQVIRPRHALATRREARLRLNLAKCIAALAESGVHNPEEIKRLAIEEMFPSATGSAVGH
jgi:hypothetical protein